MMYPMNWFILSMVNIILLNMQSNLFVENMYSNSKKSMIFSKKWKW